MYKIALMTEKWAFYFYSLLKISEKGLILYFKNPAYLLFLSSALCWILGGVCHNKERDELPD